jgi:hypothetical protein
MKTKSLFFFLLTLFATPAFASETTHLIGTTGYMIREAMFAKANKKDPVNYWEAVRLQREAKKAFRGKRKGGRNLPEAVELTRQAYERAKLARDNSQKWPYETSKNNFYKSIGK